MNKLGDDLPEQLKLRAGKTKWTIVSAFLIFTAVYSIAEGWTFTGGASLGVAVVTTGLLQPMRPWNLFAGLAVGIGLFALLSVSNGLTANRICAGLFLLSGIVCAIVPWAGWSYLLLDKDGYRLVVLWTWSEKVPWARTKRFEAAKIFGLFPTVHVVWQDQKKPQSSRRRVAYEARTAVEDTFGLKTATFADLMNRFRARALAVA